MAYFSRKAWGARPARHRVPLLDRYKVEGVALHWPAITRPLTTVDQVTAALRSFQNQHMDTNKWSDIGYQIAVDQAGNWFKLRGMRHQSAANGNEDVNERFGAILLLVAQGEQPTPALIRTTRSRIRTFQLRLFPNGDSIVGHKDVRPDPTACPGPAIDRLISRGTFDPSRRLDVQDIVR